MRKSVVSMLVLAASVLSAPTVSEASEKQSIKPTVEQYDKMYAFASELMFLDGAESICERHSDWAEDIFEDCASYKTVMQVCRFYIKQREVWEKVLSDDRHNSELELLSAYWKDDKIIQYITSSRR